MKFNTLFFRTTDVLVACENAKNGLEIGYKTGFCMSYVYQTLKLFEKNKLILISHNKKKNKKDLVITYTKKGEYLKNNILKLKTLLNK